MKKFVLGENGPEISCITLGTDYYGKTVPEELCFRLLDLYTELGGNTVDTAHVYSDYLPGEKHSSEKVIGKWLRTRNSRKGLVISTKGGFPELDDYHKSRITEKNIREDLWGSLECLGVDSVDIYWLHRDDESVPIGELVELLNEFRTAGLIGCYGFSNFSPRRVAAARGYARMHGLQGPEAVQIKWGYALTNPENIYDDTIREMDGEYMSLLKEHNMPLFAYCSQAKGFFSKLRKKEDGSFEMEPGKCRDRYYWQGNLDLYTSLEREAGLLGIRVAELAMRKMLESDFPVTLIVGSHTEEQLRLSMRAGE